MLSGVSLVNAMLPLSDINGEIPELVGHPQASQIGMQSTCGLLVIAGDQVIGGAVAVFIDSSQVVTAQGCFRISDLDAKHWTDVLERPDVTALPVPAGVVRAVLGTLRRAGSIAMRELEAERYMREGMGDALRLVGAGLVEAIRESAGHPVPAERSGAGGATEAADTMESLPSR